MNALLFESLTVVRRRLAPATYALGVLLAVELLSAQVALAQYYVDVSVDWSVGDDGTLYATGITNAGGMQEHSAYVATGITSPTRQASWTASVYSGGYVRADTSLPFNENDVGNFSVWADGSADCPVFGPLGSAVVSKLLKAGTQQVQFYWDTTQNPQFGCYYANNCGSAPAGSYCGPPFFTTYLNKGTPPYCYIYDSRRYFFFKAGSTLVYQRQLGGDLFSDSLWAYPCDGAIP